ncbi:3'-5' exonuclease [Sediminibacillus albus]|uniref:DNA polymerase-3 subunit epsilon/DNA polymerase-3 subunit alpha n=1 Tax=Sediminibacillus albus TaxID=407036 RepID=A0A1G8VFX1_9BACI|nr:3'-5' exonuclease [Sediminibacillus albus]SDJ64991.1 DNA polymerase-3 subunit epsilon/DNA polymerase-3 subunit alpha [Sediminibacillus albus]
MLPIDLQILKYYFFEKPRFHKKIKPYFQWESYQTLNKTLLHLEQDNWLKTTHFSETPFTIFDLETTGLIPEIGHEIISIGAIQLNGLKYCRREKFHQFVRPVRPVSGRIKKLTGISQHEFENASPFIDAFHNFLEFSKGTILVAHPAKFDIRFLQTMLKRWKLPNYRPHVIDSQMMAKWLLPQVDCQLDPLIKHFDIEKLERHHALNDAIMTAELFEYLLANSIDHDITTLNELNDALFSMNQNKE